MSGDFKKLNDTYGHAFGDEALKTVALTIKNSLREGDLVYRWGGEEFLIFLSGINLENSRRIFERIRRKIAETELKFDGKSAKTRCARGGASTVRTSRRGRGFPFCRK